MGYNAAHISRKNFRVGGMAALEWTSCFGAGRGTPAPNYSVPGVNSMCHVTYPSPNAAALYLLALLASCFNQPLWLWSKLWPYIGMGSLGTHLHQDCNEWCCEILSSSPVYIKLEDRREMVRRYDTAQQWGSTQLCGSTKSRKDPVRPKVGKDRVFSCLYDKMGWKCVMPLVLQVYFRGHQGSLNNPSMDTQSELMNCHSDYLIGSNFLICSPIGNIFITLPWYEETNKSDQAERK